ncbi:MAG: hypothetical protein ACK5GN_13080 [Pseudomonadota bacterium]
MKPATASDDNGAFSAQKSIFGPECIAIRFRPENIKILCAFNQLLHSAPP